jgi:hypothetical protein
MGVRLAFDVEEFDRGPVKEEQDLLERAYAGDEVAIADLLLRYEDGKLQDTVVKTAVVLGQSAVTRHIAQRTLQPKGPNGRTEPVSPRMFFQGLDAKGKRGVKANADCDKRLAILMSNRVRLTQNDAKKALIDRPAKLHRVEAALIKYVQKMYRGASKDMARDYVRWSFPGLPWEQGRDEDISYEGWY